jgi:citrate synthase
VHESSQSACIDNEINIDSMLYERPTFPWGLNMPTKQEGLTALLLHGLGPPKELFTATFAIATVLGWTAHCLEQLREGRLIRPDAEYVEPVELAFSPVNSFAH